MKQRIRKIGNSMGLIIPQSLLNELGQPEIVEMTIIDGCLSIRPSSKAIRRKPRDKDEIEGLYNIMVASLDKNVIWTGKREMERRLS
jgi:antitoxin component of MazEF toxin-antitoxin module